MNKQMNNFFESMKNARVSAEASLMASKVHKELKPMIEQIVSEVTDLMNDKDAMRNAENHDAYVHERGERTKDIISKHYPTAKKAFEDICGFREWEASHKAVDLIQEVVHHTLETGILMRLTEGLFNK